MKLSLVLLLSVLTMLLTIDPVRSVHNFGLWSGEIGVYRVPKDVIAPFNTPFPWSKELTIGRVKQLVREKGVTIPLEKIDLSVNPDYPLLDNVTLGDLGPITSLWIAERVEWSKPRVDAVTSYIYRPS